MITTARTLAAAAVVAVLPAGCGAIEPSVQSEVQPRALEALVPAPDLPASEQPTGAPAPAADPGTATRATFPLATTVAAGLDAAHQLDGQATSQEATLYATTVHLLREHGRMLAMASRRDAPPDAATALDDTAQRLADLVGLVSAEHRTPFLDTWSDLTAGLLRDDADAVTDAINRLSAILADATDRALTPVIVDAELTGYVDTARPAIAAVRRGDASAARDVAQLTRFLADVAHTFATGFGAAAHTTGRITWRAAALRGSLTSALHEHTALVIDTARTAARHGDDSEAYRVVRRLLHRSAVEVARDVGAVAPHSGVALAGALQNRDEALLHVARTPEGVDAERRDALRALESARADVVDVLTQATGSEVPPGQLRTAVAAVDEAVIAAVDDARS